MDKSDFYHVVLSCWHLLSVYVITCILLNVLHDALFFLFFFFPQTFMIMCFSLLFFPFQQNKNHDEGQREDWLAYSFYLLFKINCIYDSRD